MEEKVNVEESATNEVQPEIQTSSVASVPKSRLAYILLGLFLGNLGIHNFYAGYTKKAVIQLLITILLGWLVIPAIAVFVWVIIDICTVTQDSDGVMFT